MSCFAQGQGFIFDQMFFGLKRILFLTDFSNNATHAIAYGQLLLSGQSSHFFIMHSSDCEGDDHDQASDDPCTCGKSCIAKKIALSKLRTQIAKKCENEVAQVTAFYTEGNLIENVRRTVAAKNIDLIVIGNKGEANPQANIMGRTAQQISTRVQCPLLLVPKDAHLSFPKRIAFPSDFTVAPNANMLKMLSKIRDAQPIDIDLLHIDNPKAHLSQYQDKNKQVLEQLLKAINVQSELFANGTLGEALENYAIDKKVGMIAFMAKNQKLYHRILRSNSGIKNQYGRYLPFLLLHEKMPAA